ncbi:MAG: hypothetical protein ACNFW9_04875 [Candidatus Kerfeldbacteria bacterium]
MDISGSDVDTDTVVEYDSTIVVQVDTLVFDHYDTTIVVEIDTVVEYVYDTTIIIEIHMVIVNHYDTTFVDRIDTLYIDRVDTILIELPPDTVTIFDTTFVELPPDTVTIFDTTFVELPPDTVIQIITETDTVYIPIHDLVYYECSPWKLEWEKWADTVNLNNPYSQRVLLGFDRITLGNKPSDVEPAIFVNGEEIFFQVYGEKSLMIWVGPMEVPANAEIVIKFTAPYYGKVASPQCHDFLKGSHWFMVNADSVNYVP